jgi:hypothetical protein
MNKKDRTQHGKKESSPKQDHLGKSEQSKHSDKFSGYQPMDQGKGLGKEAGSQMKGGKTADGGSKQEKGWMAKDDGSNRGNWIPEGGSKEEAPWIPEVSGTQSGCLTKLKSGCFPKVLILFLSILAIGASLVLA